MPSANNLAGMLTKALPQPAYERLDERMGIIKYQSPVQGQVLNQDVFGW
jgi:hypothetical protein